MSTSIRIKVSKRLKELRQKQKLTQQKLAEVSGLEYKYIQRIEGKNPPNLGIETLEKITKALKTNISKIVK